MTIPLLSPSEVALAKAFGDKAVVSSLPEEKGADVLIYTKYGLLGLQRKEVPHDFVASFTDGRMARELSLLSKSCMFTRVVGEGRFRYWPDGTVDMGMDGRGKRIPTRFTRAHIKGMIHDIEFVRGVMVDWTESVEDTVEYIRSITGFLSRSAHTGLFSRPSAKGTWYVPTAKDIDLWVLQSFPGIGPSIADNIIQHFGGSVPLKWDCTLEELMQVPKLGPKKAKELWESLPMPGSRVHVPTDMPGFSNLRRLLTDGK